MPVLKRRASIQWTDIFDILEEGAVAASHSGSQQEVTDWMVQRIGTEGDKGYFVHLDDVDHAGHATSFTTDSAEYVAAIEEADRNIGQLLDAILEGPNIADEEWLIIVTTDHGGDDAGTHGTMGSDYNRIPLFVAGPAVPKGQLPDGLANHLDVQTTVLD